MPGLLSIYYLAGNRDHITVAFLAVAISLKDKWTQLTYFFPYGKWTAAKRALRKTSMYIAATVGFSVIVK